MNTRIMAIALVAMGLVGMRAADAEEVVMVRVIEVGSPPGPGLWTLRDITVITLGEQNDGTTTFPGGCGDLGQSTWENIEVVVIEPRTLSVFLSTHAAVKITMHPRSDFDLAPGTRLANITSDVNKCCVDEAGSIIACTHEDRHSEVRQATFQVVAPASAGSALLSSPVELDAELIGVVTGEPNDDGTHTVIFKKQGSPARQVDINADVELLPADVLRDLVDLGQDPDTGEHLYLADIEW